MPRTLDWVFVRGIRAQLDSLRLGFTSVFPMDKLGTFTPAEVKTMLCGDQDPVFTRDEVIKYTEPKLGYSKDSPGFLKFVNVLVSVRVRRQIWITARNVKMKCSIRQVGMTGAERKAFLQFTTGCSSLPPGGLANLHPR